MRFDAAAITSPLAIVEVSTVQLVIRGYLLWLLLRHLPLTLIDSRRSPYLTGAIGAIWTKQARGVMTNWVRALHKHESRCKWLLTTVAAILSMGLIFSASQNALAQATSGTLTGLVTDPTGAVVPNATVTITDTQRGSSITTTTNPQGMFSRTQLANGIYEVKVDAQGFKTTQQNGIAVNVDRETRITVPLQTGEVQQSVVVVANESPVLVTDRAEISTTLPARQLTTLPTLSQNVTQLELLAPGTVRNTYDIAGAENPQGGQGNHTNGLLFGFTNRQIDGADDMDAVLGIQVVNPPPDSLDQMKVTTSNYDAEFGRSGGSFVEYTTKSGSNTWHGDAFEYLRNNFFNARNPYTEVLRQSPLRFNQFGGSLGGKIIRDKLFFFGTYQG